MQQGWSRRSGMVAGIGGLLLGLLVLVPTTPATAASSGSSYSARLVTLVNQARIRAGVAPLALFDPLTAQAASWSTTMQSTRVFKHDPSLLSKATTICSVSVVRENIGMSTASADAMFAAYMNSAGHRTNILSADTQFLGMGTVAAPYTSGSSTTAYWNTMKFVGGTCPKASTVTTSTPTTMTLTPVASPISYGGTVSLRAALVAPAGPARTARLEFIPAATGIPLAWGSLTLRASATRPTLYVGAYSTTQRQTGTWRLTYDGLTISPTVGDLASSRAATVSVRTKLGGWSTTATTVKVNTVLSSTLSVRPAINRKALLQLRSCSTCSWVTYRTYTVPSTGSVAVTWPVARGTKQWRVVVPAAPAGLAAVTPVRSVTGV